MKDTTDALKRRLDVANETNYKIGIQFRIKCSGMKHEEAKRKYKKKEYKIYMVHSKDIQHI